MLYKMVCFIGFRIALVQSRVTYNKVKENVENAIELVRHAKLNSAELVVLPALFTGYGRSKYE